MQGHLMGGELPAWKPASRIERRVALAAAFAALMLLLAALPFGKLPLEGGFALMPPMQAALAVAGLACGAMLMSQHRQLPTPALLWLAGGQFFTAGLAALQLALMPGLVAPAGWPAEALSLPLWLTLCWQAGLPLGVIGYTLHKRQRCPAEHTWRDGMLTLVVVVASLAVALLMLGTAFADLPVLLHETRPTAAFILLASGVWTLGLCALLALWHHPPHVRLDLWLGLAMGGWVAGTALSTVFTGRADLGACGGALFLLAGQALFLGLLMHHQWQLDGDRTQAHHRLGELAAQLIDLRDEMAALRAELAQRGQELEDSQQAKSQVLAGMSHELRAPLNAIIGFSEMMKDGFAGELTPQQRSYLGHVFQSGQHLLALINDTLDLSRIDAGRGQLALEPVDLELVLNESLAQAGALALQRQVRLRRELPAALGAFHVDVRRLRQMLERLFLNAISFTPAGGEVTLRAGLVDRAAAAGAMPGFTQGVHLPLADSAFQRFVQISVSDTGPGLSGEEAMRLFTPFMRVAGRAWRGVDGTGLGLAMVGRLAQLHGGSAALTSEPGQGSCFTLWLPWRAEARHTLSSALLHASHAEGPLALVVEDDDRAATLMRMQLEAEGFRVHHVASAEAALRMADQCRPDVITLDIALPGMDGWDLLALLKDVPEWEGVPVVVVSLSADQGKGFSLGAAAVLEKPVGREALARGLARLGLIPDAAHDVTVLVIDDDANAVEILASFLHQAGYVVLCAFGGEEGIELARRYRPDVIALDLEMPGVNGFDVVEALKQDVQTAHIPIVIVTARQLGPADRRALNGHILDIVGKTEFSHGRFIGEVRRALSRPSSQHQGSPSQ